MYRVFNMGIGMVAIVASEQQKNFQDAIAEKTWLIGEIVAGDKGVTLL
jgi:phosphoribosylformylglycinamidine cyclo-ligase